MSIGLLALLDDVATLIKASAASLDDIPALITKTSSKVSGIVIDDAAVTPKYVVGIDPARELCVIYKIAKKSLINKVLILGPAALLLGFFLPEIIPFLLMFGGGYLCLEGYEKVHSLFKETPAHRQPPATKPASLETLEKIRIQSAVQTDFILSSEIIAITYSTVADADIVTQIIVILSIGIGLTVAIYGFVGLVVKADDVGLHMAMRGRHATIRLLGRALVKAMPPLLKILGYIGTAAMLWVGAEIIAHGILPTHHALEMVQHRLQETAFFAWLAKASICAVSGLVLGAAIALVITPVMRRFNQHT